MRVVAVSDNSLARSGLAATLREEGTEVAAAVDRSGAVKAVEDVEPDAVVVDVADSDGALLEWLSGLCARFPGMPVIGLGEADDALTLLGAGAAAVLASDVDVVAIVAAVEAARHGLVVLGRGTAD